MDAIRALANYLTDGWLLEARVEAKKARLVKSVFKMKLANLDLPLISFLAG
jgi:hypothetical protein